MTSSSILALMIRHISPFRSQTRFLLFHIARLFSAIVRVYILSFINLLFIFQFTISSPFIIFPPPWFLDGLLIYFWIQNVYNFFFFLAFFLFIFKLSASVNKFRINKKRLAPWFENKLISSSMLDIFFSLTLFVIFNSKRWWWRECTRHDC